MGAAADAAALAVSATADEDAPETTRLVEPAATAGGSGGGAPGATTRLMVGKMCGGASCVFLVCGQKENETTQREICREGGP